MSSKIKKEKTDGIRVHMRLHRYSIHTERFCCHRMRMGPRSRRKPTLLSPRAQVVRQHCCLALRIVPGKEGVPALLADGSRSCDRGRDALAPGKARRPMSMDFVDEPIRGKSARQRASPPAIRTVLMKSCRPPTATASTAPGRLWEMLSTLPRPACS